MSANRPRGNEELHRFGTVLDIMTSGGDERILLDAEGRNRYHVQLRPVVSPYRFSSTTASPLSERGYAEARATFENVARRIEEGENALDVCKSEVEEIKSEILALLGYGCRDASTPTCLLSPSGTDAHKMAAKSLNHVLGMPLTFLTIEGAETGSGVAVALSAASDRYQNNVISIPARDQDGKPLTQSAVKVRIDQSIRNCIRRGSRAVLVATDVSKTGLIWPSIQSIVRLKEEWGTRLEVIVDACQMRISARTLRYYLSRDFLVVITGSKFLGGPTFSGALLMPSSRQFSVAFSGQNKTGKEEPRELPPSVQECNLGLVIRWRVALAEWKAFSGLNESMVSIAVERFGKNIDNFINGTPQFELISVPPPRRDEIDDVSSWAAKQSIFTFLIKGRDGNWMSQEDLAKLHSRLAHLKTPILFGQPVLTRVGKGHSVAALRIGLSAPLLSDIASDGNIEGLIQNAILALSMALTLRV